MRQGSGKFGVKQPKGRIAGTVVAEAQRQLSPAAHQAGGEIDQLLHHRAQAPVDMREAPMAGSGHGTLP